jgi:hypothetical protein
MKHSIKFSQYKPITISRLHFVDDAIRGWVDDGQWWLSYYKGLISVHAAQPSCSPEGNGITWTRPINTIEVGHLTGIEQIK